jgi:uncharacterized damage-inducible protein DinB
LVAENAEENAGMNAECLRDLFLFNTFANEGIRKAMDETEEAVLRETLDGYWFDSLFTLLTHTVSGETVWLDRLRTGTQALPHLNPDDFTCETLVQAWRQKDHEWEDWLADVPADGLYEEWAWRRSDGRLYSVLPWQVAAHVATHSTNHRGHVTVAMTALGIKHGPQEFLDQYRPID